MKIIPILLLIIPLTLFADGPVGENTRGFYGMENMFSEDGQVPMPPKAYNKILCARYSRLFRPLINRFRTVSYRIERKCSKSGGSRAFDKCINDYEYGKKIIKIIDRHYEVIGRVCLPDSN